MCLISLLMASFSSSVVCGEGLYTLSLRYPHKKKSGGLKSAEWGGHSISVFNDMTFCPNLFANHSSTATDVCGAGSVLLKPNIIQLYTFSTECWEKLALQNIQVTVLIYSLNTTFSVLIEKWTNDSIC